MQDNSMEFHRGRLIDHVHLRVADVAASKRFYQAVLQSLGRDIDGAAEGYFFAGELFVDQADSTPSKVHLAFQAKDKAMNPGPPPSRTFIDYCHTRFSKINQASVIGMELEAKLKPIVPDALTANNSQGTLPDARPAPFGSLSRPHPQQTPGS